jgi:hypothetical protein
MGTAKRLAGIRLAGLSIIPRAVFPGLHVLYMFFVLKSFRESEGKIYLHYQLLIEPLGGNRRFPVGNRRLWVNDGTAGVIDDYPQAGSPDRSLSRLLHTRLAQTPSSASRRLFNRRA